MAECDSCPSNDGCSKDKATCMIENNPLNNVKKIIAVMSGKGGVGKSSISVLIAKQIKQLGYSVGVLDADVTGPSIPRLLDLKDKKACGSNDMILPIETSDGMKVMSLNFVTENEDDPVICRGPILSNMVKQFWTGVLWGDLDFLVIDMPPGTGDVALTVLQTIPIDGIVMVSVPQDFISMIVSKAVNMAKKLNINVLGVIENMSYISCPDCGKKIELFRGDNTDKFIKEMDLKLLGELPMLTSISNLAEDGYDNRDASVESIFKPIVNNIIKDLE